MADLADPLIRREQEERLASIARDLQRVGEQTSWHAIKYLTLVNGAGAIALLSFMGTNPELRHSPAAWAALTCFFLGITLVGVLIALGFHKGWKALTGLARNATAWRRGELEYEAIFLRLMESASITASLWVAYGSFAAFIVGALTAILRTR